MIMTLIAIVVVLLIALKIWTKNVGEEAKQSIFEDTMEILEKYPFDSTHAYASEFLKNPFTQLSINAQTEKIQAIIINITTSGYKHEERINDFKDLIEVKINKNSDTLVSTTGSRNLAGAAVGGLLFGGTGAVVGGLGSATTSETTESVESLSIELVFNDIDKPLYEIFFLNRSTPIETNTDEFKEISEEVNEWYRRLEVIIHQNQKGENH